MYEVEIARSGYGNDLADGLGGIDCGGVCGLPFPCSADFKSEANSQTAVVGLHL